MEIFLNISNYAQRVAQLIHNTKTIILQRADQYQASLFVRYMQETLNEAVLSVGHSVYDSSYMMASNIGVACAATDIRPCNVSADIIVNSFEQLGNICFVHGNWLRDRIDTCINFIVSRNMIFAFLQLFYNIYCGFSGTPLFNSLIQLSVLLFFGSSSILNTFFFSN